MEAKELKRFLDDKVIQYNCKDFIATDPISIPHQFKKKQDIEIAGFFAAIFAWGIRTTIINKSNELMQLMHMEPFDFCLNHTSSDLKKILQFKHRTFNATDLLYCIEFLKFHYSNHDSLESAFFSENILRESTNNKVELGLIHFHNYFFSLEDAPNRTRKHIATPYKNSTCKRLNMYLRWMARKDKRGVDFGIWENIQPSELICPLDLHVTRVAKRFQLLDRKQADWTAAIELTQYLRNLDPQDPIKYDFALFGLGVIEKFR